MPGRRFVLAGFALLITLWHPRRDRRRALPAGRHRDLLITSVVVIVGILIRRHYTRVRELTMQLERGNALAHAGPPRRAARTCDPTNRRRCSWSAPIAVSASTRSTRVEALFPSHFRNFVFVSVGTVDSESFGSEQSLRTLQYETRATLDGLVNYAQFHGKGSRWYDAYGADRSWNSNGSRSRFAQEFPNSVFFTNRLVFENEHWWTRWLHSETPLAMQRVLNLHGLELVILPVMLRERAARPAAAPA